MDEQQMHASPSDAELTQVRLCIDRWSKQRAPEPLPIAPSLRLWFTDNVGESSMAFGYPVVLRHDGMREFTETEVARIMRRDLNSLLVD